MAKASIRWQPSGGRCAEGQTYWIASKKWGECQFGREGRLQADFSMKATNFVPHFLTPPKGTRPALALAYITIMWEEVPAARI